MFDTASQQRAVQLLRGHLSPEQLTDFDKQRKPPDWAANTRIVGTFHWFNVVGSLGNQYTITGFFCPPGEDPGYGALVGAGHDKPRSDWCVHVFSTDGYSRRMARLPTGDEMLAYKLAIECDEAGFLSRAAGVSDAAARLRLRHHEAIEQARAEHAA